MRERGYPEGTIWIYAQHLRGFLSWLEGRPPAALETLRDYARFIAGEDRSEPVSRATCAAISLFFVWRVETGISRELPDVSRIFHPEGSRRGIRIPEQQSGPTHSARAKPEKIDPDSSPWGRIAAAADRLEKTDRGKQARA